MYPSSLFFSTPRPRIKQCPRYHRPRVVILVKSPIFAFTIVSETILSLLTSIQSRSHFSRSSNVDSMVLEKISLRPNSFRVIGDISTAFSG
ncbi:hypothetical protein ACHAW6_004352 [Cyclotella cf. meneghiniana]